MPKIKKFKIKSDYPEDETFDVTKVTVHKITEKHTQETDEFGNVISGRRIPQTSSEKETNEGIVAYGKQSRKKAHVTVLETDEGLTKEGLAEHEQTDRNEPMKLNPTKFYHRG